jgi:hypothetical protein
MVIAMGTMGGRGKNLFSSGRSEWQYLRLAAALQRRQGGGAKGSSGGSPKSATLHEEALKWIEQNAGKGKYANLDKSRVAVSGASCGGLEA